MDRRTFLLGFLGGLAVAPAIIAATSSADAAPLPGAPSPSLEPLPDGITPSTLAEADPETIKADWTQAEVPPPARRRLRRGGRRVRRTARRGARRARRT